VTAVPEAADGRGAGRRRSSSDFEEQVHVYEPHRASLPPLGPYMREFWRRRRFAYELSRTTQKADNFDTALGSLWLVLNPLLLGLVYFLLVSVLGSGGTVAGHKVSWVTTLGRILIGLFTWFFGANAMGLGAGSITSGGRLILNQAFPRALLPLSSTISALLMFLPSIPVYILFYTLGSIFDHSAGHLSGFHLALVWYPVLLVVLVIQNFGLAMIFATMSVYFRDTNKFLSYLLRIWLYLSPVLYGIEKFDHYKWALYLNPMGPVIGSITRLWVESKPPSGDLLLASLAWAVGLFFFGAWFFISRERDFAVRI
jgi:teichoic acid transport system permease protein